LAGRLTHGPAEDTVLDARDEVRPAGPLPDRTDAPRRDPVLAAAVLLIVGGLAWRASISARGSLAQDDFMLAARSLDSGLIDYVLTPWNNHLMPGGLACYWFFTRWTGTAYWPYLLLTLLGQAVTTIVFLRLLRRMLRPGWAQLVPLAIFLFSPIGLESTAWTVVAVNAVPMHLAMLWAISAQHSYVETRRRRHLASLGLALAFGLLFFEKSILIAPLVALVTVFLYSSGGPLSSIRQALGRYWRSWVILGAVSAGYLAVYAGLATSGASDGMLREPASAAEVAALPADLFGTTLIPGLLGGPVTWLFAGDGPPLVDPPPVVVWASGAVLAGLVIVTVARRRVAIRAWIVPVLYAVLVVALLGATRLGTSFSPLIGVTPRYVSDVAILAALCIGVAICGLRGLPTEPASLLASSPETARRTPRWTTSRPIVALAVVTALAAVAGTAVSGARYADAWSHKVGRDYVRTAQADLAAVPPGAVFFDRLVPLDLVWSYSPTDRLQSRFFAIAKGPQPTFATEGEDVYVIGDDGHIRPAWVIGPSNRPGPDADCGWLVEGGAAVTIPLEGTLFEWPWAVRIAYLSSVDTVATIQLGSASRDFPVRRGLHQYFLLLDAGGDSVEITLRDAGAALCTDELTIGNLEVGA
jgi:hypothetical protein